MEVEPSAADAELLRSAEESLLLPLEPSLDAGVRQRSFLILELLHPLYSLWLTPHRRKRYYSIARACKKSSLRSWRKWQVSNAEHFSNALAADQAVLRNAEEKIGTNFGMTKQEHVRLRDHRSRSLGTTCLTITGVLVVSIAFVTMLFIVRLT